MSIEPKDFNAIAFQRTTREQMSKDMESMTFAERQAYIQKKAAVTMARTAKAKSQEKS